MAREMEAEMPEFMSTRKRIASRGAKGEKGEKQAKVVEMAEEAASAASGGGKASKQAVLIQLAMVLTRMCMMHSRELGEIIGVIFKCILLPLDHQCAILTMEGGDEYQEMVNERREALEKLGIKKKGGKSSGKGKQALDEDSDMDEETEEKPEETVPLLPSPHVYIGVKAIGGVIQLGSKGETPEATASRDLMKKAWDLQIKGQSETKVLDSLKVWRGRKPQKQSKGKKCLKLILCIADPLQEHLVNYLVQTGGQLKQGQAPKGYLEREAANLMKKLGK